MAGFFKDKKGMTRTVMMIIGVVIAVIAVSLLIYKIVSSLPSTLP